MNIVQEQLEDEIEIDLISENTFDGMMIQLFKYICEIRS